MAAVCSKVSRNIALMRNNGKCLSLESCQKLASGLVMAILNYGNALYYGTAKQRSHKASMTPKLCCKTILVRNKYFNIGQTSFALVTCGGKEKNLNC